MTIHIKIEHNFILQQCRSENVQNQAHQDMGQRQSVVARVWLIWNAPIPLIYASGC
jgi:hypothetical protein